MSAATIAAIGIVLYLPAAALILVWGGRRIDATFAADMHRVLRSDRRGRSEEADRSHPQGRSAVAAGVERGGVPSPDAPPAPCPLVGATDPQRVAPARPPRVMVHG